jgi:hypothetical protein
MIEERGSVRKTTYENGVVEEFSNAAESSQFYCGVRHFPDGSEEVGEFESRSGELWQGYHLKEGRFTYMRPESYGNFYRADQRFEIVIVPTHAVTKQPAFCVLHAINPAGLGDPVYERTEEPLFESILQCGSMFSNVLDHPQFPRDQFLQFLFTPSASRADSMPVMGLPSYELVDLLRWMQDNGRPIDLRQVVDPNAGITLFAHWAATDDLELIQAMLEIDKTLISEIVSRQFISNALLNKQQEMATFFAETAKAEGIELTEKDRWLWSIYQKNNPFTDEAFLLLSPELQDDCYRAANIYFCESLLLQADRLLPRLRERSKMPERGSIFSCSMNAIDVRGAMRNFLVDLRGKGLLLTSQEFQALQKDYLEKKRDIGRILGRNYLAVNIQALGLTRIKVPQKIAVFANDDTVTWNTSRAIGNLTKLNNLGVMSYDLRIYAQKIHRVERWMTRDELMQLTTLIEAVDFYEMDLANFIVAEDGIYIIDTEWRNFDGVQYDKFKRLLEIVAPEDRPWCENFLNLKIQQNKEKLASISMDQRSAKRRHLAQQEADLHLSAFDGQTAVFSVKDLVGKV